MKWSRLACVAVLLSGGVLQARAEDFSGWSKTLPITFTGYGKPESLANFPALVTLGTNLAGFSYADFASPADGADLRFADRDLTNALNFEIETWNTNGASCVWVQVPVLAGTNTRIMALWGNPAASAPACATNGATWSADFRGVWHMKQTNVLDATTNANNGVGKNGITTTNTGVAGQALYLNNYATGSNYVDVGTGLQLGTNSATLSIWFRTTTNALQAGIIGKSIYGSSERYSINGAKAPNILGAIFQTTTPALIATTNTAWDPGYYDNQWHQLTATFNRTGNLTLYVDGAQKSATNISSAASANMSSTARFLIGAYGNAAGTGPQASYYFPGSLDEGRLMKVPASSNWVWAAWKSTIPSGTFSQYGAAEDNIATSLTVRARSASDVSATTATLNGVLVHNGGEPATEAWFCWDDADRGATATGNWARVEAAGASFTNGQPFAAVLAGLLAGSTYVYRCYATNATGQAWSSYAQSFRTVYTPSVTNAGAVVLGPTTALLQGAITDAGGETPVAGFLYWLAGDSVTSTISAGTQAGAFNAPVGGLAPGSNYVFMAMASNAAGVAYSGTNGFKTASIYYVATTGSDGAGNDGLSWAKPFLTISNGVAHAVAPDTVLVSNGTYNIYAQITVAAGITLMSANNDQGAVLEGGARSPWSILFVNSANAKVSGFTLRGGRYDTWTAGQAGGLTLAAGVVSNCTIRACQGYYSGGALVSGGLLTDCLLVANTNYSSNAGCYGGGLGVNGGTVANCMISNNATVSGGGVYMQGGVVTNCTIANTRLLGALLMTGGGVKMSAGLITHSRITGNVDTWLCSGGGGVYMTGGRLRTCLVAGNGALDAGGIYMANSAVENCTVAGNAANGATAAGGIRLASGSVTNSIIYGNSGLSNVINAAGSIGFSCAYPAVAGTGNTAADPQFLNPGAGDYRLTVASPCRDAGANLAWAAGATDLDGNARVVGATLDMGAYESGSFTTGALSCDFTVSPAQTVEPGGLTAQFTTQVGGGDTNGLGYAWDIENDGTTDYWGSVVSVAFTDGFHDVRLVVTNGAGETATITKTDCVRIYPATVYAATNGLSRAPYDTWAKAATNLADAVTMAGMTGTVRRTVLVSNGTYRVLNVVVDTDMTLQGAASSRDQVVLNAGGSNPSRVITVNAAGAFVSGLTFYNAAENCTDATLQKGPGLWLRAGTVSNCVIRNCSTDYAYGTVYVESGLLVDSAIVSNGIANGPSSSCAGLGLAGGTVKNCLIFKNGSAVNSGACNVSGGLMTGCTVAGNTKPLATSKGITGGVRLTGGRVENSWITGNGDGTNCLFGGGAYLAGGVLRNCLVAGNIASNSGGIYMTAGLAENCTVATNRSAGAAATASGLLFPGGTGVNCVVYGNSPAALSNAVKSGTGVILYSCVDAGIAGDGNIAANPLFKNSLTGNYHLASGSPCIDAGTNLAWTAAGADLDGLPRLYRGRVDMGVFESVAPHGTVIVVR